MQDDPLLPLKKRFAERCGSDLARLRQLSPHAIEDIPQIISLAHGLAGAGGTFGFPAVSDRASALEDLLGLEAAERQDVSDAYDDLCEELAKTRHPAD
ncbi:Hpt domain-containing protein [Afifella sp. JA880]|uniref:Hpt domain-containing protein n=1 Tax=Afifella sp. JA880 TaxID=2975280 RepID=UPI0021BAA3E1|nr:Hpt domain-containing protein [Afifella sp. JA880]MCT8266260.1 Hpt domain-containing protein [Afifella sp. JA880]